MENELLLAVQEYVEENIGEFHKKRLASVNNKSLRDLLKRKNPYLFRVKTPSVHDLVSGIMDAFLSSQEEGLFGNFLEGVAVFVAERVYGGYKPSPTEYTGIDLIFEKLDTIFLVEIKSGPNWGNSSQVAKMYRNFQEAIVALRHRYPHKRIIPVNGCMYGKVRKTRREGKIKESGEIVAIVEYWKICGQDFWQLISDDPRLYIDIIEPLGYRAKERNEAFLVAYDNFLTRVTGEFINSYANKDGSIAWDRLAELVSRRDSDRTLRELTST